MKFSKIVVLEPKPYLKEREKELKKLADCVQFYDTDPASTAEIIGRLRGCDAVILGHTKLKDFSIFEALPSLRYIGLSSTDYSLVDVGLLKKFGIALTNVPGYATDAVAEFVFSQLFTFYKNKLPVPLPKADCLRQCLSKKIMGIIGLGRIGTKIAEIAQSYGSEVIYFSRHRKSKAEATGVVYCELNELLKSSDIVVVACSLNEESYDMLNEERLAKIKEESVFVNIARADIVDYEALAKYLNEGRIGAAILDVLPQEPPTGDEPILTAKNAIITPHIAWKTEESIRDLCSTIISNIQAHLSGEQTNRVV